MSSDESEDDFVSYGTPLDPLDEDALPRKKAFTLEDQVAKDAKGRRRFHGAFTGGFSAGFMNTVGSLEGWKPSEFKSSRADRTGGKTQRPQDFMDDEDLGEFGIAPQRLIARDEYSGSQEERRKRPAPQFSEGPIPGVPVLAGLLQPVRETVGIKLLKNMGWRPGQGVGPRITKKEKKRVYGCSLPPGEEQADSGSESDFEFENVTYAPDDIKPYIVTPKKNSFGLGYSGLDRHSVLGTSSFSSELKFTDRKRKVNIRGQAFGVGAFEEEDEDIYSKEDMSQYDFEMGAESSKNKPVGKQTAPVVLEGFVLSKTKVIKKNFPPPALPKGFKPRHVAQSAAPTVTGQQNAPVGLGRHDKNALARGLILGEPIVPSTSRITVPPVEIAPAQDVKTETDKNSSSFQPFKADPDKQKRYEQYLNLNDKNILSELQPVHLNSWEREREAREFAQAEKIFKPLTGIMGDRFTTSSQSEDLNDPMAKVQKTQTHGTETKREAAKMKMFGPLTREESPWRPCSLICKRFNVPEPDTSPSATPVRKTTKYSIFDSLDDLAVKIEPATPAHSTFDEEMTLDEPNSTVDNVSAAQEPLMANSLPQETPFLDPVSKVDLFKAIFLDSSDDEETVEEPKKIAYDEPIVNTSRNKSPPRGLFANVDLDALSVKPASIPPPRPITIEPITTKKDDSEAKCSEPIDLYGPKIPDKMLPANDLPHASDQSNSSSSDDWVEKTSSRSKKEKKNKKHKKHKSKHKKQKKKK